MEYFLSKVADLQAETIWLKRDSAKREDFQNSLSVEDFGVATSFLRAV